MDTVLFTFLAVVIVALIFDYINGFHDTANAIATVVSTGVLPMRTAILLAAIMNLLGAWAGTEVAKTISKMINAESVTLVLVLGGLSGAIFWNLFTWWFGIPSSSSHALLGGVLGAAIVHAGTGAVRVDNLKKTLTGLFLSPLVGFVVGIFVMIFVTWIVRHMKLRTVNRGFRVLQMVSASGMAFAHGSADAQKTMGIIMMALLGFRALPDAASAPSWVQSLLPVGDALPTWVKVTCAAAMALGTMAGGVRIIKTMGSKIIDLKPIHGFAAETTAALTIMINAQLGAPVSTTHVISSAIMGVGASQRVSAVRWGVTAKILWAWALTIPISGLVGGLAYKIFSTFLGP
jgi:inorganic phosphate transporter, PiT family